MECSQLPFLVQESTGPGAVDTKNPRTTTYVVVVWIVYRCISAGVSSTASHRDLPDVDDYIRLQTSRRDRDNNSRSYCWVNQLLPRITGSIYAVYALLSLHLNNGSQKSASTTASRRLS